MKRNVSFTSMGMALGAFPDEANVVEPIATGVLYFDNMPPSKAELVDCVVPILVAYERFSKVLDIQKSTFQEKQYEMADLVREINLAGDNSVTHEAIESHLHDPLQTKRNTNLPWWEILVLNNTGIGQSACMLRIHHVIGDGVRSDDSNIRRSLTSIASLSCR